MTQECHLSYFKIINTESIPPDFYDLLQSCTEDQKKCYAYASTNFLDLKSEKVHDYHFPYDINNTIMKPKPNTNPADYVDHISDWLMYIT